MIGPQGNVRIYLACGATDMRKGFETLAAQVQTLLHLDPHLCVACDYVAARSRHGQSRGHDQFCRHIITCDT